MGLDSLKEMYCLDRRNKRGLCGKASCRNRIILEDWANCYEKCEDRREPI